MKVHHRENAAGVDARLLAFLDWWETNGPMEITVPADGGVRFDKAAQLILFQGGFTQAMTLQQTPHGRAGALDLAPLVKGVVPWKESGLFLIIGECAERQGLEWGGRWKHPDSDHIQVPDWKHLPYPPAPLPSLV